MTLESINLKVVVAKMLADMKYWNPFDYWKRVTSIMWICAGHQNDKYHDCCSVNSVKVIKYDIDNYNGHYKAVASRKGHKRYCLCLYARIHLTTTQFGDGRSKQRNLGFDKRVEYWNHHHEAVPG